jgi:DnaK suppressor protein
MAPDLPAIRATLAARHAEWERRGAHVHAALVEPVSADSAEAAVEQEDDEVLEGEAALIARERAAIAAAIARIDDGSYGDCTRCGAAIDPRRLAARPEAALCHPCATALGG